MKSRCEIAHLQSQHLEYYRQEDYQEFKTSLGYTASTRIHSKTVVPKYK